MYDLCTPGRGETLLTPVLPFHEGTGSSVSTTHCGSLGSFGVEIKVR